MKLNLFVLGVMIVAACSTDCFPMAAANAQDEKRSEEPAVKKPAPTLKLGDPAPALKVSKWLQGDEIKKFKPGKVYVVEFWATWCGPCIAYMPHIAELQMKYQDKGVTVIGYSDRTENNTEKEVTAFVKKHGLRLPYTFAYGDDRGSYDAWMTAAGERGIPCSFVVDKAGRIAYIGHPYYLGIVVPRVLADAKPQAIRREVNKIGEEQDVVIRALEGPDAKAGLQALAAFGTKYPPLANNPSLLPQRFRTLAKAGQMHEAKRLAEDILAMATKQKDSYALSWLIWALPTDEGTGNKELLALSVKAAEAMVQVDGDKDARALIILASRYLNSGDKAKAKDFARKAVEAAAGEPAARRLRIQRQAKTLGYEVKADAK